MFRGYSRGCLGGSLGGNLGGCLGGYSAEYLRLGSIVVYLWYLIRNLLKIDLVVWFCPTVSRRPP